MRLRELKGGRFGSVKVKRLRVSSRMSEISKVICSRVSIWGIIRELICLGFSLIKSCARGVEGRDCRRRRRRPVGDIFITELSWWIMLNWWLSTHLRFLNRISLLKSIHRSQDSRKHQWSRKASTQQNRPNRNEKSHTIKVAQDSTERETTFQWWTRKSL